MSQEIDIMTCLIDELMNKNTKHVVFNPKMIQPTRRIKEKWKIALHRNGFQTLFSRTPLLMVVKISMRLVDLLALDTISYGCGDLIRTLFNTIGDEKKICKKVKIRPNYG